MNKSPMQTNDLPINHRRVAPSAAMALALLFGFAAAGQVAAQGEGGPVIIEGEAALAHPATKAMIAAVDELAAGRLADVKSRSTAEVREEWAAMPADEKAADTDRARDRAPARDTFETRIRESGVLMVFGDTANLQVSTADGADVEAMAYATIEDGQWKVTSGPMTFEPAPVETAPALTGEAILEHEIGKLVLDYAGRLQSGKVDTALELLSGPARAKRAADDDEERAASDRFRMQHLPAPDLLAEQIRNGGQLAFVGEMAYLNVVSNTSTSDGEGTTTSTSTTFSVPFELQNGVWMIGD